MGRTTGSTWSAAAATSSRTDPERGMTMLRNVDWTRGPEGPRSVLTVLQLPLSDLARLRIAAAALGLSVVIVVAVWAIRPLLPSLVMKPGRLTPFAILAGALSAGLAGVWALAAGRKRASGKDGDVL